MYYLHSLQTNTIFEMGNQNKHSNPPPPHFSQIPEFATENTAKIHITGKLMQIVFL